MSTQSPLTRRGGLLGGVASVAILVAVPGLAWAQASGPDSTAPTAARGPQTPDAAAIPPADQGAQVGEVVVTAQKRSERLLDVPASVSVVDPASLAPQGLVQFQDYAARVPGLSLTSTRTGSTQVTLRGITTGPAQSASSTAFYIDEAPIGSVNAYAGGSSVTPDLDPSDLSQVEVLKGPQGTLYGAGAVGGLVKFITAAPNFDTVSGHLSASGTTVAHGDEGYAVRGNINVPLVTDRVVLRASGFSREDPGYIDNRLGGTNVNDAKVRGGRAAVTAKLTDKTTLDVSAFIQDTRTNGLNTVDSTYPSRAPIFGPYTQSRATAEPGEEQLHVYNATLKSQVGVFDLTSSSTYQVIKNKISTDGTAGYGALLGVVLRTPNLGIRTVQTEKTERFSQELRADSKLFDGRFEYQLGFYYTHENDSNKVPAFQPFSTVTGAPIALPNIISAAIVSKYTEFSGFANATYHFTDKLKLLAGVRYSHDEQPYDQDYSGLLVGARRVNIASDTDSVATFLVSPQYEIARNNLVYLRISSGYRPGGPNAVPPPTVATAPNTFQPDTLTSYEVGYKGALFDRRLTLEIAGFYTDWDNIQIQTSAGGFNFFVNGGSASSRGGEITARLTPLRGLTLGLNGSYIDAVLTSSAPAAGGVDGDRLPFVPHVSGSVTADYTRRLVEGWDLLLDGSVNYTGSRRSDYTLRANDEVPSFTTVNLRIGVEHNDWGFSLYAKNVNDSRGIVALASRGLTPTANPFAASIIQPRLIGAEVSYKF